MATINWRGDATPLAETQTFTIGGSWIAADTVTCTINGKSFVVTLGSTSAASVTAVAAVVVAAWEGTALTSGDSRTNTGTAIAEFSRITATNVAGVITLTADDTGVPFTCTTAKSSTSGTVGTPAVATAASGPYVLRASNVSGGTLPGGSDTFVLEDSTNSLLYGLDALSGTLTKLDIKASFEGRIGLPRINSTGSYSKYRAREFAVNATTVVIGEGDRAPR